MNHLQGWKTVWICYCHALEEGCLFAWVQEDCLEAPAVDGGEAVEPLEEVGELALDARVAAHLDGLRHGLHSLPRELQQKPETYPKEKWLQMRIYVKSGQNFV